MKLKKKRKSKRMRGSRTHGYAMKKHKGSGNRGGKGMAGTGKRAGQKLTYWHRYMPDYFGKQGITSRKTQIKKENVINVEDIEKNLSSFGKKTSAGWEINLQEYKILGSGEIKEKLIVKAKSFSKSAREKIEKAGGRIIIVGEERKEERK